MPCGGADMMCVFVQLFSRSSIEQYARLVLARSHIYKLQRNHLPSSLCLRARASRDTPASERRSHARRPHRP